MFEQVLREITQKFYGLFNKKNYNEKAVYFDPYINNVLSFKSRNRKYWDTHDILPCNFEGIAVFRTEEEIKSFKADMFDDIMRYYRDNDPFTKIIGKVFNHSVQNLNLDYNQGKRTANNAMEIKTINVENQEEA
jgi:hypothetical protein